MIEQLEEYFAGERREFDLDAGARTARLRARASGTRCARSPTARPRSYGEIARAPRPARRAPARWGAANGRNPIPVVVPCHRVIGADGSLTGYGGGLERKRLLLELEAKHSPAAAERLFAERLSAEHLSPHPPDRGVGRGNPEGRIGYHLSYRGKDRPSSSRDRRGAGRPDRRAGRGDRGG